MCSTVYERSIQSPSKNQEVFRASEKSKPATLYYQFIRVKTPPNPHSPPTQTDRVKYDLTNSIHRSLRIFNKFYASIKEDFQEDKELLRLIREELQAIEDKLQESLSSVEKKLSKIIDTFQSKTIYYNSRDREYYN